MTEELSTEQLSERLAVILRTWPLYREFTYTGTAVGSLPRFFRLFCPGCGTEQNFGYGQRPGHSHKLGHPSEQTYTCQNCSKCHVSYSFWWGVDSDKSSKFFKIGQWPALEEPIPPELEKVLKGEDIRLYRNAIRLRNFNLGLGGLAYMRRVVENRMNDILDALHESGVEHKVSKRILARVQDVKAAHIFSKKVDYAALLFPQNLHPDGLPNPMAALHSLASDGLHGRSEDECADIFDRCKVVFEYVFATLRPSVQQSKTFVKNLSKLTRKSD
jgi:hypothetical protein